MKVPRFSGGRGQKRTFCGVMWNEEGMNFYQETLLNWRRAYNSREVWEKLEVMWEGFVAKNRTCQNVSTHWRRRNIIVGEENDDGSVDDRGKDPSLDADEYCLFNGDEGYEGDGVQAWRQNETLRDDKSDNGSVSSGTPSDTDSGDENTKTSALTGGGGG